MIFDLVMCVLVAILLVSVISLYTRTGDHGTLIRKLEMRIADLPDLLTMTGRKAVTSYSQTCPGCAGLMGKWEDEESTTTLTQSAPAYETARWGVLPSAVPQPPLRTTNRAVFQRRSCTECGYSEVHDLGIVNITTTR